MAVQAKEMKLRSIQTIVKALEQPEGAGATVRRSVGTGKMRKFNPFLLFDHFSSSGANGFPHHPHLGQETITLITKGAMAHEDFTGSKGILYAGDLQFMTAGRGIVHSEMPVQQEDGSPTVGLQLWVDLPEQLKEAEPRYRDLREWEIPEVVEQDGKLRVKVISGKSYGVESVKDLAYTPVQYYHVTMKPGATFEQDLPEDYNFFLYVMAGDGFELDGTKVGHYDNAFLNRDGNHISGVNKGSNDVEFILIGGEILDQHTVHYGPFVAKNSSRIQKAVADFQYGRDGFSNVKTWQSLISEGVTKEMVEGPLDGNLEKRAETKEAYLQKNKVPEKDEL